MRAHRIMVAALAAVTLAGSALAADTYTIDTAHSKVGFSVRHMVIGTVRGVFNEFSGTITTDPEDATASRVEVSIKAASIDTGNDRRDQHLRSADFLAAERFPEITFVSKTIRTVGEGYVADGTLTIRGVSRPVSVAFRLLGTVQDPWGKTRVGIELEPLTIDRQEFGVSWSQTLDAGGLVAGNEVTIELAVEAVKEK